MSEAPTSPAPSRLDRQRQWLASYSFSLRASEQGRVVSVGDGIVWIEGLPTAAIDEILYLEEGSRALVFHLGEKLLGAILLDQTERLSSGSSAASSGVVLSIPVGDALLGRVIDPLGRPMDGQLSPKCERTRSLDVLSPPIMERDFVNRPFFTGNKMLDNLIPLGKGQRQLLIGDNGLGKSSLALDIVVSQKGQNVRCVYVMIGQKRSSVVGTIQMLKDTGAIEFTTVVVAEATSLPGLQYLAPFAGCTIAEEWMRKGQDTLVIYDDLSTHANSYRELSLLLRRPPGREAYPADIFYLHSRLLERSTCLSAKAGGGSMTALPIIETKEGELAAFIPTNLISITDGQVYFEEKLFSGGFLPAIDITKSVSRVGGAAQPSAIRKEAGRMKLDYLQFLELEVFTRFGAKLEPAMQKKIQRGRVLREILKQERLAPVPIECELAWMIAFNEGTLDGLAPEFIQKALQGLFENVQGLSLSRDRKAWVSSISAFFAARGQVNE